MPKLRHKDKVKMARRHAGKGQSIFQSDFWENRKHAKKMKVERITST